MRCIFCKTDEKEVRYMLTKNDISVCDKCVLLLGQKLSNQLRKDEIEMLNNLKTK